MAAQSSKRAVKTNVKAKAKPKKPRIRYNLALCEEICIKVTQGAAIKTVLASSVAYPSFETWCAWKRKHVELSDMYYKSIRDKSEHCIDKIYVLMDKIENKEIDYRSARVLIDTQKWLASKFYPKMYGVNSSLDITSQGKELQQQVTVFQLPDNNRAKEESQ
ncbi:MAG: hypothetical protein ACPGRW_06410 [Flavobacteriaceae bacterium]